MARMINYRTDGPPHIRNKSAYEQNWRKKNTKVSENKN